MGSNVQIAGDNYNGIVKKTLHHVDYFTDEPTPAQPSLHVNNSN